MRKVIFDQGCNQCGFTLTDTYDEPALGDYGQCPQCETGRMKQIIGAISHKFTTPPDTASKGRTTNGMRWEVGSKVKKYNPANGTFK